MYPLWPRQIERCVCNKSIVDFFYLYLLFSTFVRLRFLVISTTSLPTESTDMMQGSRDLSLDFRKIGALARVGCGTGTASNAPIQNFYVYLWPVELLS